METGARRRFRDRLLHIGFFMGAAVLGGALSQWPLGKWSDRTDRRRVIAVVCLAAAAAAGILVLRDGSRETLMLALAFLFGICALPLYGLCVAHANDQAPPGSFVQVSGDLLMMFGVGAIFGPYAASLLITLAGPAGIFMFTGSVHLALAGYTVFRIWEQKPVPAAAKEAFVVVPGSTQAVLPLDPRSDGEGGGTSEARAEGAG